MRRPSSNHLRGFNNGLTVIAVALALYLIITPFIPQVWWWGKHVFHKPNLAAIQVLSKSTSQPAPTNPIPSGYWLDIPRLSLHRDIGIETSVADLDKGPWHVYGTSTPDKGSNTVIAGHRFGFDAPFGPFYFLNKLEVNDRITVDWLGTEYTYRVVGSQTVPPTDGDVQAPTKDPQLTLYTCTPLWSAKDRLVVTANLVAKRSS